MINSDTAEPVTSIVADPASTLRASDTRTAENQAMLDQFYSNLEVVLVGCRAEDPDHDPAMAARIAEILATDERDRRWLEAYQADLFLSQIRPRASLKDELTGALAGLKRGLRRDVTAYDEDVRAILTSDLSEDAGAQRARALLFRVLSERHWHASQRNLKRQIGLTYAGRLFWALVAAIGIFAATITLQYLFGAWFDSLGWSYTGFSLAGSAGFLGAVFSMMTSHSGSLYAASIEEAQLVARVRTIMFRVAIGGTAAIILYFVFESGVIAGMAFPDLEKLGFASISVEQGTTQALGKLVPNAELCKLMVWSFLAGFSEKLVPQLLGRAETGRRD